MSAVLLTERLASKIRRCWITGCWDWAAYRLYNGYGRYRLDGRIQYAHRVVYAALVGPIPPGLDIDHLCRNRGCVNPAHLEAITRRENTLRGKTLPAAQVARTHCPQGHPYSGENLYVAPDGHRKCCACTRARRAERRAA